MEEKPNGKRETENMEKREGSWPEGPGRDEDSANWEKRGLEGRECLFLYSGRKRREYPVGPELTKGGAGRRDLC